MGRLLAAVVWLAHSTIDATKRRRYDVKMELSNADRVLKFLYDGGMTSSNLMDYNREITKPQQEIINELLKAAGDHLSRDESSATKLLYMIVAVKTYRSFLNHLNEVLFKNEPIAPKDVGPRAVTEAAPTLPPPNGAEKDHTQDVEA